MKQKIELIKAEIERQMSCLYGKTTDFCNGQKSVLTELRSFINSLPEEHVSKELEEAAEECLRYTPLFDIKYEIDEGNDPTEIDCYTMDSALDMFKAGAQWQRNNVWHEASEMPQAEKIALMINIYGGYMINHAINTALYWNKVDKWAYIDDLLPKSE